MAAGQHQVADDPHSRSPGLPDCLLIPDRLDMLVTGDPIAELDDALGTATSQLRQARRHGDLCRVERLVRWINLRLDERNTFAGTS
jgi:hypothetical protein